jgi:serine protease Do
MKASQLLPVLVFSIHTLCLGEDLSQMNLTELRARLGALEHEKQEITAQIERLKPPELSALILPNGEVNPRISNAVVIIEGDTSAGTGFIVRTEGKTYLYTAAHVLSGNRKLTIKNSAGSIFKKFGTLEAAEGADLIRILITEEVQDALQLVAPDATFLINNSIAALGNGGGNGVVAVESGTILGTSADFLEITSGVIPGNSGGPVVEATSGQAVGVVTHLSTQRDDLWAKGTRQAEVRRFACRLNKKWTWQPKTIGTFLAEGTTLVEFDRITKLCFALSQLELLPSGMRLDQEVSGNTTILNVINENLETEIVRSLVKMNNELSATRTALSPSDLKKKFRGLLQQLEFQAKRSSAALQPKTFAWYHRHLSETSVKQRAESLTALELQLERLE